MGAPAATAEASGSALPGRCLPVTALAVAPLALIIPVSLALNTDIPGLKPVRAAALDALRTFDAAVRGASADAQRQLGIFNAPWADQAAHSLADAASHPATRTVTAGLAVLWTLLSVGWVVDACSTSPQDAGTLLSGQ